jgi:hypothetical protein
MVIRTFTPGTSLVIKLWNVLHDSGSAEWPSDQVGAVWDRDGMHFFLHTGVYSMHIAAKKNTVNSFLREWGFVVCPSRSNEIRKILPTVDEPWLWRKRSGEQRNFTIHTTLEEVQAMRVQRKIESVDTASDSETDEGTATPTRMELDEHAIRVDRLMGRITQLVDLGGDDYGDPAVFHAIAEILDSIPADDVVKIEALVLAHANWVEIAGQRLHMPRFEFVTTVFGPHRDVIGESFIKLADMLCGPSDVLGFNEYLGLMMLVGPLPRLHDGVSQFCDASGRFCTWFRPDLTRPQIEERMRAQPWSRWAMRRSDDFVNAWEIVEQKAGVLSVSVIEHDVSDADGNAYIGRQPDGTVIRVRGLGMALRRWVGVAAENLLEADDVLQLALPSPVSAPLSTED